MLVRRSCATRSFDTFSPVWFFNRAPSTPITSEVPDASAVVAGFVGVADVETVVEFSAMVNVVRQ